jgi:hypothetical protein
MLHVLTNLKSNLWSLSWSSSALSQYLEPHKEFFIWLHAIGLSQSYLNSWDHHGLDIEPYLEFFSCRQTLKILKLLGLAHRKEHGPLEFYTTTTTLFLLLDHIGLISSIQWSWCQYLRYIFIFMASLLWIQYMDFKKFLWTIPSYKAQWEHRP